MEPYFTSGSNAALEILQEGKSTRFAKVASAVLHLPER
jgi:hypothetical protein